MTTLSQKADNGSIILTTGMLDLLKDQIRQKKMSPFNDARIVEQLKNAKQVLRSQLTATIVDVNTQVNITDLKSNQNITYIFVALERARSRNNTEPILSPIGLALIGYPEGAEIP